jgi:ribosomal protein S1
MPFGAFVELSPGVEGLIHISELSHERVQRVSSVVKADEVVTVKVLAVDADQRRISLSLKAARAEEEKSSFDRDEDPHMRKLKAQLSRKFGDNLKGGLG